MERFHRSTSRGFEHVRQGEYADDSVLVSGPHDGRPLRSELFGGLHDRRVPFGYIEEGTSAHRYGPATDLPADAQTGDRLEIGCLDELDPAAPSPVDDRPRDGMLRQVLQRRNRRQQLGLRSDVRIRHDLGQLHTAFGERPGLVEQDGVELPGSLQDVAALDEDAELRPPSGADHHGRRGSKSHRTRAGDDQDGDGYEQRVLGGVTGEEPRGERSDGDRDDDRYEDGRDSVGEMLDRRLAHLSVFNELGYLR